MPGHVAIQYRHGKGLAASSSLAQLLQSGGPVTHTRDQQPHGDELLAQDRPIGLVVVNHQHALRGHLEECRGGAWFFDAVSRHRALQAHGEPERAAPPQVTVEPNLTAHLFHQALADRQPESGAAKLARHRHIALREGLEQACRDFGRDADARIGHVHSDQGRLGRPVHQTGLHGDFATLGELHGVADEVHEHLTHAARVAYQVSRHVGLD